MPEVTVQQAIDLALQCLREQRLADAEAIARQVVGHDPNQPDALHILGMIARSRGDNSAALGLFDRAIAFNPGVAEFHANRGLTLQQLGQSQQAIEAYRTAIRLKPELADAHYNLGVTFQDIGDQQSAAAAYRAVLALNSRHVRAHHNLGTALHRLGRRKEAAAEYRTAIALDPALLEAHANLANVLKELGVVDEAVAEYRHVLRLRPDFSDAYDGIAAVLKEQGLLEEAIENYRKGVEMKPDDAGRHSNLIFTLQFLPDADPAAVFAEHRLWAQRHAEPLKKYIRPYTNDRDPERKLRIGYVSADFREHPAARFFLPLLEGHDRASFEVFCYSNVVYTDRVTEEIRARADVWREVVKVNDDVTAERIRNDKIDILIDLTAHSGHNRLLVFARKPAPVQVTYLGYPGTTGLEAIDYRLTDPYLDPLGQSDENRYSERSFRLPETYWCYRPTFAEAEVTPLPASSVGLVTFGCLNNPCKVNAWTIQVWSEVLRAVPKSRLMLHAHEGSHRQRIVHMFAGNDVEPGRIQFAPMLPLAKYFEMYRHIDIALDPFPYAGGTTSCDGLLMGVPLVTLAGKSAVGRAGVSILSNIGLMELISNTPEQYIEIAAKLAADLPGLARMRAELRPRMQASPLMDVPRFTRNLESAFRTMWRTWCDNQR